MTARKELLQFVATNLLDLSRPECLRVAIDGVDGAGKTTFGDELAEVLRETGRSVIRASVDGFHNPRSIRYRLGSGSPEGFFRDSYDYPKLKVLLLDPLSPGGSGLYTTAYFDHTTDSPVMIPVQQAAPGAILLFDGIFLHRPELRPYWDFSIFLDVRFDISIPRGAQRGMGSPDPGAPENHRYVEGQKIYLRECDPTSHAALVIDNNDLEAPKVVRRGSTSLPRSVT